MRSGFSSEFLTHLLFLDFLYSFALWHDDAYYDAAEHKDRTMSLFNPISAAYSRQRRHMTLIIIIIYLLHQKVATKCILLTCCYSTIFDMTWFCGLFLYCSCCCLSLSDFQYSKNWGMHSNVFITGSPNGPVLFCWLSSSVTLPACGPAGRRAGGRSGGRHCTVGQSCYVPLGRHLVSTDGGLNLFQTQYYSSLITHPRTDIVG